MSELPHPLSPDPSAPVLRLVEWIASDPESGVLRLRGDFPDRARTYPVAPELVLRDSSGALTRRPPLNEDPPHSDGWRAAYLVAGALLGGAVERWLEWPDGSRLALPEVDVSAGDGRTPAPPPEHGAEVFDRAVLAERRAQRAESAQRAQARTAEAAVAALGALERRVEELTRERDALAHVTPAPPDDAAAPKVFLLASVAEPTDDAPDLASELEAARAAWRAAEADERRQRQALDEALGTLGRLRVQAAELRLRMRIQVASASADAVRLTVLEGERRGLRGRLHDLRGELDGLRARFAGEQARGQRLAADLEGERAHARRIGAERDELRDALAGERQARAHAEEQLRAERATTRVQGARVVALEAQAAETRALIDQESAALRRRVEDLGAQLRAERSTRASLAVQLRVARSSESAARAEAAARKAAQSKLRREHADALAEAAAARAELAVAAAHEPAPATPASDTARREESRPERRLARLEAELGDTRAALQVARARLHRAAPAATSTPVPGGAGEEATASIGSAAAADPPRRALNPDVAAQLRRRLADLQAAASLSPEPAGEAGDGPGSPGIPDQASVAARLDEAAASLRAAMPGEASTEVPARDRAPDPVPAPVAEVPAAPVGGSRSSLPPTDPAPLSSPTAAASSMALTVRAPSAVVVASRPTGDAVPPSATRRMPSLRAALVRLAAEDPFTAARLLAALLPAQGAFLREDIDYDLTIRELGTFAVTVAAGRTSVRSLHRPRPRREAQMHLTAHALTLAELLAGRPRRVGRMLAPVRLRGSREKLQTLAALAESGPGLAEVARAGAVLDPALLARVLPHLIDAADTDGRSFTVAQEVIDRSTRTWYLVVDGRRGLRVQTGRPVDGVDARVTMSRATLDRLLRREPLDPQHKPWVRGDFGSVELLRSWIDAARG